MVELVLWLCVVHNTSYLIFLGDEEKKKDEEKKPPSPKKKVPTTPKKAKKTKEELKQEIREQKVSLCLIHTRVYTVYVQDYGSVGWSRVELS